jgi:DNA-binding NarL/FixJ family response regulator
VEEQTDPPFPPASDLIRVLLAGGHALFRQAVRASLDDAPDIVVVGEVPDAERDIEDIASLDPDVVLVDASESQATPARTTALVRERAPRCRVVVLGDHDARILVDVVEAGASGYLTQDAALTDLIETARAVFRGETLIPHSLLGPLVSGLLERRRDEHRAFERLAKLTPREREVLELLATGANNHGIARVLSISPETARTHVQNLLTKLGVHSRLEAASFIVHARPLVPAGASR